MIEPPESHAIDSFFSISFELVATDQALPYDLFINSSSLENREKFVKLLRAGDALTKEDLKLFRTKYHQIYVRETQRSFFLKSLVLLKDDTTPVQQPGSPERPSDLEIQKTSVLKESAIHHLAHLFEDEPSTEVLGQTISGFRDVVENMIDVLQDYSIDKLRELIGSLSFHDFYTYDHSVNVSMYCILIYKTLKPNATQAEVIQAGMAGLLHDLGKIKIPTHIINNAGKLSEEEFKEIQKHPGFGNELLNQNDLKLPGDLDPKQLGEIVMAHHENFDGTGYPRKLAGNQIHVMARITAIADFFDAITTKRSYQDPLSIEEAISLMRKFEGKKLDPKLFELFLVHAEKMMGKTESPLEFLTEEFDPCQPHDHLPLGVTAQPKPKPSEKPNAGSILVEQQPAADFGKVKVIVPPPVLKRDPLAFGQIKVIGGQKDPPKPFRKKK
ncbi:MAG: hypothetical protein A2X94_11070 [Bdellovibrionales bacterium GWB1_55_8]|nr:MAG: hypothetical protein A2X94_11070 [Bdellovibrionales bacterium GWB1_55_8]